ncbi:MAG: phosphotransferase [Candidatus Lokiarchaeota archaeon]|nr:phosphotransferase [Candidatus Harpocratesius repetitus]
MWYVLQRLPKGFCHGDLHSGNIFKTKAGSFTLFDFDASAFAYPIIDIATISNATDFNQLKADAFDETLINLERFLCGYGRNLSKSEKFIFTLNE